MCREKFHRCKYCTLDYPCLLTNIQCPTINDDEDSEMCDNCRQKLEDELEKLENEQN